MPSLGLGLLLGPSNKFKVKSTLDPIPLAHSLSHIHFQNQIKYPTLFSNMVNSHTHTHTHIYIYVHIHMYIYMTSHVRPNYVMKRKRKNLKPYTLSVFSLSNKYLK